MPEIESSELRPAFVYLSQKGKSNCEIVQIFGVSVSAVNNVIIRLNKTDNSEKRSGFGQTSTSNQLLLSNLYYCRFQSRITTKINLKQVKK
jgi:hypothetical protein